MASRRRFGYEPVLDNNHEESFRNNGMKALVLTSLAATVVVVAVFASRITPSNNDNNLHTDFPILGLSQAAQERCDYVIDIFESGNRGEPHDVVAEAYHTQSEDYNVFYRATAELFWKDFVANDWDDLILNSVSDKELDDKSTWTWITGDQHLSNFGAWHNRGHKVVFGVNDFDESAIYDFHVDVIRLAVSICNHANKNGFSENKLDKLLEAFAVSYIDTVTNYVGNERALTFELTADTSKGVLRQFLKDVVKDNSHKEQLEKYTDQNGTFVINDHTHLEPVDPEVELQIRQAFTSTQYGATLMKTGWHVPKWNDDYFAVTDVARRVGSGVGSYGVDRYYVLLAGQGGVGIILDVKYEPESAVSKVLSDDDKAWYNVLFRNAADRAVQGQRRLTSYVDPFTGWVQINGKAFVVRQRSPWKDSPDLDDLTDFKDFRGFIEMVAIATATSHTRGTQAKAPGEFKQVIASVLGKKKSITKKWGKAVAQVAKAYHEQVLLDFDCFKGFVETNYPLDPQKEEET